MRGVFEIDKRQISGDLSGTGEETELHLNDKSLFFVKERHVFGETYDGLKVSLIDCLTRSQGTHSKNTGIEWNGSHYAVIFPHVVATGDRHLSPDTTKIKYAHVLPSRDKELFHEADVFGEIIWPEDYVRKAISKQAKDLGRPIKIGPWPRMWYFSGRNSTKIGRSKTYSLTLNNFFSMKDGIEGISVNNNRYVSIYFRKPVLLEDVRIAISDLMLFLGVMVGGHVFPSEVQLEIAKKPSSAIDTLPRIYVTWSLWRAKGEVNPRERLHPIDLPIRAGEHSVDFARVLSSWLSSQDQKREARHRFSECFDKQNFVDVDRLIGAANVFDILPREARPSRQPLTSELSDLIKHMQKQLRGIAPSSDRDRLLDALGRVGGASLTRIVEHRAKLITDRIGDALPNLDLVIRNAIKCRNRYVHGTPGPFNYESNFEMVHFFTHALEFIFAASELVESGWDIAAWERDGKTGSHPFSRFIESYQTNILALFTLVNDERS